MGYFIVVKALKQKETWHKQYELTSVYCSSLMLNLMLTSIMCLFKWQLIKISFLHSFLSSVWKPTITKARLCLQWKFSHVFTNNNQQGGADVYSSRNLLRGDNGTEDKKGFYHYYLQQELHFHGFKKIFKQHCAPKNISWLKMNLLFKSQDLWDNGM